MDPVAPVAPVDPAAFDLSTWLLSFIPPEMLVWILAHPFATMAGLYVLSALLSSVPTTYTFEVPKIGLRIPVGYLVHFAIGNVFQVLRKVSPTFAGVVDKLLPGKRADPEALKVSNTDPRPSTIEEAKVEPKP